MKNNWLADKRSAKDYSHQEIADLVGIDRSYYTKIENGLVPSVKVAQSIAKHLEFEWTIFFASDCVENAQNKLTQEVS
ncbi:helix-turn-helix transcriptional regulator [Domibacillus tundrae]|uniref:helix-turn-helix transcriptional regulator n=1 Tax=Domibacillus tundrae TaxID=1587527 RepID=UPI000617F0B5|nr:helix-turn-helix transcriptional regulator [Domibacillus tundrae]